VTKKKTTARKRPANKTVDKPVEPEAGVEDNVQPIGPQYKMSREELLTYQTFKAKFELADEKIKLAQAEREMASLMRDSLIKNVVARLSLQDKKINIDFDQGQVTVLEEPKKGRKK